MDNKAFRQASDCNEQHKNPRHFSLSTSRDLYEQTADALQKRLLILNDNAKKFRLELEAAIDEFNQTCQMWQETEMILAEAKQQSTQIQIGQQPNRLIGNWTKNFTIDVIAQYNQTLSQYQADFSFLHQATLTVIENLSRIIKDEVQTSSAIHHYSFTSSSIASPSDLTALEEKLTNQQGTLHKLNVLIAEDKENKPTNPKFATAVRCTFYAEKLAQTLEKQIENYEALVKRRCYLTSQQRFRSINCMRDILTTTHGKKGEEPFRVLVQALEKQIEETANDHAKNSFFNCLTRSDLAYAYRQALQECKIPKDLLEAARTHPANNRRESLSSSTHIPKQYCKVVPYSP